MTSEALQTIPTVAAAGCTGDWAQSFLSFWQTFSQYDKLLICEDVHVHVCSPSDQFATDFKSLLATFKLIQSVDKPTHHLGHTSDLVISFGLLVSLKEISETEISDHLMIHSFLP